MYTFAFLRQCNPMRTQQRGCTYTIRKNTFRTNEEGNGTAWIAVLGSYRGYDDVIHQISPVIVALRGLHCVATEKARKEFRGSQSFMPVKF
jgi:hypothetical protein